VTSRDEVDEIVKLARAAVDEVASQVLTPAAAV
jgi:L-2,4-diaminobutyrate transaminase